MQTKDILIMLHNMLETYQNLCSPVCRQTGLTQNSFDILMFLANNPEFNTAKDISNIRAIKANIISFSVDRLVKEGYLERFAVPDDRRKVKLICTKKAAPLIEQGHAIQKEFYNQIYAGFKDSDLQTYFKYMEQIYKNMETKTTTSI